MGHSNWRTRPDPTNMWAGLGLKISTYNITSAGHEILTWNLKKPDLNPTRPRVEPGSDQKIQPGGQAGPGSGWRKRNIIFFTQPNLTHDQVYYGELL